MVDSSGNANDALGDFSCTVDLDTVACTGFNDEEGDILVTDMVLARD